jgi:polar amino acid transport system substrate-binding protein
VARDILGDEDLIVFKSMSADQRIPQIQDRKVDMVIRSTTITCERLAQVAFSTVYFESGLRLLVPKNSPVTEFEESQVKGRTVCANRGSTALEELRRDARGADVTVVNNQLDCLVRLQLGEVDAILTDAALGAGDAAQDPQIHMVGTMPSDKPYGVAMHQADTDLVRRVNHVLEQYRSGGRESAWMRSFDTWLAKVMDPPAAPPPAKYRD